MAAVELAIVLPFLLLLVFGLVDFGRALNEQILLTQAAREGARAAALGLNAAAVQTRAQSVSGATLNGTAVTVTLNSACSTSSTTASTAQVTVSHTFVYITPVGSFMQLFGQTLSTPTIAPKAVMGCVG